ncbi:MAG: MerR family transcriptional regulator [Spirochaetaceae bacterium]|nr:MerR family transcriptional regulator [Spirochaetaceae bacterium]
MLSIGEFSQASRLSVKTIRYYQELGILIPSEIDEISGYRYFNQRNFERAQSIVLLKELGFTLKEIQKILADCDSEDDLNIFIEKKLTEVERKLSSLKKMKRDLQQMKKLTADSYIEEYSGIIEFDFELPCYAGLELVGKYELIGKGFARLYKEYGRFAIGKPFTFYSDMEYKEDNVHMEAVIQLNENMVRSRLKTKSFRKSRAVKIIHHGAYGTQGASYVKLYNYCRDHDFPVKAPVIEHYIKGPGMIFRGNPDQYQTECILLIDY